MYRSKIANEIHTFDPTKLSIMTDTQRESQAEDEWEAVSSKKRPRNSPEAISRQQKQSKLDEYWLNAPKTSNKYEPLSNIQDDEEATEKVIKPPPIFVYSVQNLTPLTEMLEKVAKNMY